MSGFALGPYVAESELGRGGMGAVYAGRDARSGRRVAIKVLARVEDERLRERFRREALALGRLSHPGIVRVLDAGLEAAHPWLVMELVEGETLAQRVERAGPLEPRAAAQVALEVARALAHAHRHQLLHRDVKPENVLLAADGRAVLADFGLVKGTGPEATRLTATGHTVGTPVYMPPEQVRSERGGVDPRSDVYALGATLYASLTGAAPFEGDNLMAVIASVLEQAPRPPGQLRPGLDPALERLCLRCLEKDPGQRPASAEALAAELEAWLTRPARAPRAGRRAALVLVPLLVGAALLWVAARGASPTPADPSPPPASPTPSSSAATPAAAGSPVAGEPAAPPERPGAPPLRWRLATGEGLRWQVGIAITANLFASDGRDLLETRQDYTLGLDAAVAETTSQSAALQATFASFRAVRRARTLEDAFDSAREHDRGHLLMQVVGAPLRLRLALGSGRCQVQGAFYLQLKLLTQARAKGQPQGEAMVDIFQSDVALQTLLNRLLEVLPDGRGERWTLELDGSYARFLIDRIRRISKVGPTPADLRLALEVQREGDALRWEGRSSGRHIVGKGVFSDGRLREASCVETLVHSFGSPRGRLRYEVRGELSLRERP
ncbi:MAG: serine/threonine-protein kinase [Planctomycetota bacterium]